MPKVKSNPRFVLTFRCDADTWVAVTEGNSAAEFRRLKKRARQAVQQAAPTAAIEARIYLCMDAEPSSANLLTDIEVNKWRTKSQ